MQILGVSGLFSNGKRLQEYYRPTRHEQYTHSVIVIKEVIS